MSGSRSQEGSQRLESPTRRDKGKRPKFEGMVVVSLILSLDIS